jgi:hypothetical protein
MLPLLVKLGTTIYTNKYLNKGKYWEARESGIQWVLGWMS